MPKKSAKKPRSQRVALSAHALLGHFARLDERRRQREMTRALERHTAALEDATGPDAARGKLTRESAAQGGHATRKRPAEDAILIAEVLAVREANPHLKWSAVCEKVAKRHGWHRTTVARGARAAKW